MNYFPIKQSEVYITILLLPLLMVGCSYTPEIKQQGDKITIDLEAKDVGLLNLEVKSIIKLDSNNESLFGDIIAIKFYKDKLYILDQFDANTLFMFSSDGKFLKKIEIGRGPGEMLKPHAFDIDESNDEIIIHDEMLFSFYYFDLDLNFVKKVKHNYIIQDFKKIGIDSYLIRSPEWRGVEVTETTTRLKTYAFVSDNFKSRKLFDIGISRNVVPTTLSNPISTYKNKTLFISSFNNNIYQLINNSIRIEYSVDFGKHTFTDEEFASMSNFEMLKLIDEKERLGLFLSIIDSDEFLVFDCAPFPTSTFFYSYKSKVSFRLDDCIEEGVIPQCQVMGYMGDNTYYALVKPGDFMSFTQSHKEYSNIIVSESANPLFLTFKINE